LFWGANCTLCGPTEDVLHDHAPQNNGKQESFWGQIEGRLLPMLEGVADLSLDQLNEATLAWIELEYNRKVHSQTEQTPLHQLQPHGGDPRLSPSLSLDPQGNGNGKPTLYSSGG
jgi:hypothetical protein